jgi:hypothetical protein
MCGRPSPFQTTRRRHAMPAPRWWRG